MAVKERKPDTLGVLLIDFNPVVREGLQSILAKDDKIEVIGDVPDGYQALQHIKITGERGRTVNVRVDRDSERRSGWRASDQAYQR